MRSFILFSVVMAMVACSLRAADLTPPLSPEKQALADFSKGVNNPDKATRIAALEAYAATKPPPSSWSLYVRVAETDPEMDVRHAAFTTLAKLPSHTPQLGRTLVQVYSSLKPNDMKERLFFAKAMEPSEFKADVIGIIVDQLERMRWAVEPMAYNGRKISDKVKEDVKEKQDELKDFVSVLNQLGKADLPEANKEINIKVKKWWDTNQAKFVKADTELAMKYAKEDADAAKAAKEAAATAKK